MESHNCPHAEKTQHERTKKETEQQNSKAFRRDHKISSVHIKIQRKKFSLVKNYNTFVSLGKDFQRPSINWLNLNTSLFTTLLDIQKWVEKHSNLIIEPKT